MNGGKRVENQQKQLDQPNGKNDCAAADEHGLRQKLFDQLRAIRAEHFAHAHLFGAMDRPRGGQIHEINAGDDQHEQRDAGKDINVENVVVGFDLTLQLRGEMDILHRLQEQPRVLPRRRKIFLDDLRELGFKFGGGKPFAQLEISPNRIDEPTFEKIHIVRRHQHVLERGKHVVFEMRVLRRVRGDASDLEIDVAVVEIDRHHFAENVEAAKIFLGNLPTHHHAVWMRERSLGLAAQKGNRE
ncbi:MAG: hypothetical protein ALAOOOJD_03969 [bacterium]|nr:hypothetical protein [bacterium]